jgi:hypothetical protein
MVMSALMRLHHLKAGRTVQYTRIIPKSKFSYILLGLHDGHILVVIRKRKLSKNKIQSFEVVDFKELSCDLATCYKMIIKDRLNHFKEITDENNQSNISIEQAS